MRRYTQVIFNRVRTLEQCISSYDLSGCTVIADKDFILSPIDTNSAILDFNEAQWNQVINTHILKIISHEYLFIEEINSELNLKNNRSQNKTRSLKSLIKYFTLQKLERFFSIFSKPSDGLIINSYLPKFIEIKLYLAMKTFPFIRSMPTFNYITKPNKELRKELSASIKINGQDNLKIVLYNLLFELLPVCFLEGFHEIKEKAKHLPWPKYPKFIFTSNCFDTDELFKVWASPKIEEGIPYFIGQHGNTYGTNRYETPSVEEEISDLFLTWGWKNKLDKYRPLYNIKMPIKSYKTNYNKSGSLLLLQVHQSHYFTWDSSYERDCYFKNQKLFIENLNTKNKIKSYFTIT